MANTKLNSTRLIHVPPKSIGLELYFLASSLLSNHTFIFEKEANERMCSWMDELALARKECSRFFLNIFTCRITIISCRSSMGPGRPLAFRSTGQIN